MPEKRVELLNSYISAEPGEDPRERERELGRLEDSITQRLEDAVRGEKNIKRDDIRGEDLDDLLKGFRGTEGGGDNPELDARLQRQMGAHMRKTLAKHADDAPAPPPARSQLFED